MIRFILNNPPLEVLFQHLSSALLAVSLEGKVLHSNRAAEALWGYSGQELREMPDVRTLIDEEAMMRLQAELRFTPEQSLTIGETLLQAAERLDGVPRTWKYRHKNGQIVHSSFALALIPTISDQMQPFILLVADAHDNANELRNLKTHLLSRISHEIRTPLHGVIGALELLSSTSVSAEQAELLTLARSKADLLLSFINDIFEYSRSQSRTFAVEKALIEPRTILANVAEVLAERIASRELRLATHFDEGVPKQVLCDPVRLYQVLVTVTSALAMCLRNGSITIGTEFLDVNTASQQNLLFTIRGKASQIDHAKKQQILQTLQEQEESLDLSPEILQLSLVRTVITALGGFIWGERKEIATEEEILLYIITSVELPQTEPSAFITHSKGANTETGSPTVTNEFFQQQASLKTAQKLASGEIRTVSDAPNPRDISPLAAHNSQPSKQTSSVGTSSVVQKKILIVDDDPDNCLLAEQFLRSLTFDDKSTVLSSIANNGKEALEAARKQRFDVILMDIQMPEMDGFEATARIREYETKSNIKRTPILAVTAHTMENYRELCLEKGMDDYMSKPMKKQPFHDMVKKWTDRKYVILVTDDSDDYRLLMKLQLDKNRQFVALFAENGQQAVELCQNNIVDAALMDMQMPILTGYEAVPILRKMPGYGTIPIWGLTAHEDAQEIQQVLEAGCDRCFTKGNLSVIRHIIAQLEEYFLQKHLS